MIGFTLIGAAMNFLGFNPMKALVWAGVAQRFSTPPLFLPIILMTNNKVIMGDQVNSWAINIMGGITAAAVFAASAGLVASWLIWPYHRRANSPSSEAPYYSGMRTTPFSIIAVLSVMRMILTMVG